MSNTRAHLILRRFEFFWPHTIKAMDYSFTPLTVFMVLINTAPRIFGKLPARWVPEASEEIAAKGECTA